MELSIQRVRRLPPLIGRAAALAEAEALLATTPLLTLTGPGGTGKTRLALELACDLQSGYRDGVHIVELAPLSDPSLLPEVICEALALQRTSDAPALDDLLAFLRERQAVLVLDNCEQLLPGCVELIETLLAACPQLHILATSRESLRSVFEVALPVPPLPVPDDTPNRDAESAAAEEAVQLFLRRATAVLPTFALTDENAAAICAICRRLDGLPLAIEIAASCVNTLAPAEIAAQIALGHLSQAEGYRSGPPRQQTLESTIAWSYRLLTPDEQALFRRVAILAGAFDLTAATALGNQAPATTLTLLRQLINKSLITVIQGNGESRYRLLETLRDFGQRQASAGGERREAYARYCAWAVAMVTDTTAHDGGDNARWLERCERGLSHLRAVLSWLIEERHVEEVARLATFLAAFWRQRGHIDEGRRWLERILAAETEESPIPPQVRARALNVVGILTMWQCAYARAQACHEEALTLFERIGDQHGIARTHFRLGFLADRRGDAPAATEHLECSRRISCELGDDAGADMARNRLGIVAWNNGERARASELLERSLQFQRERGDLGGYASTSLNLGILALECGDAIRATTLLEESLALNNTLRDEFALIFVHTNLGYAALARDDEDASAAAFSSALALVTSDANAEIVSRLLDGVGELAQRQCAPSVSARLWGAAEALRAQQTVSYRPDEHLRLQEQIAQAQKALGIRAFNATWEQGCSLPLADALLAASGYLAEHPNTCGENALSSKNEGTERAIHQSQHSHSAHPYKPESEPLRISALGRIEVYRGDLCVTNRRLTYAKARELLFFLLTHSPSTKERISLALWPDATPEYLRTTFRVVVYHLRRALGPGEWIVRDQQYYAFNRSLGHWYDVAAFDAAIAQAVEQQRSAPEDAITSLETACALYRGDFWEGATTSEWIAQEQERLQQRYLDALLLLGDLHLQQGAAPRALERYTSAIERDRYCEEAHRGIIRCHLKLHEPAKAARHFDQLQRDLREHLNLSPAAETRALLHS